jgi:hypothetical protein
MYNIYILLCIVNGNWGVWGAWSTCSMTCGSGTVTRSRSCDNPAPANGGYHCPGNMYDTTQCFKTTCPGIYVIIECFPSSALISFAPFMNLNPSHCEVYSIEHYVINYISELWQVGGFFGYCGFLHQ